MTNKLPTPNPTTTAQPVSEAVQHLPACGLACRMTAAAHQGFGELPLGSKATDLARWWG